MRDPRNSACSGDSSCIRGHRAARAESASATNFWDGAAVNIWSDSFDSYSSLSSRYAIVAAVSGSPAIQSAVVRTGASALSVTAQGTYLGENFTSRSSYIVGFAFYPSTVVSEINICTIDDTGTNQVALTIDGVGTLRVRRGVNINGSSIGGTVLGTASTLIGFGAWHYVELSVLIGSSTGTIGVQLDGVSVLSLTGQNTQNTANNTANQVRVGNPSITGGLTVYFDDLYMNDGTGSHNNSFLGDVSVLCRFPSANGTTNNYTNVFASFANNFAYVAGNQFKDGNGNVQRCTVAGTSQTSGTPTWATTGGATTTSGGATFAVVGTGSNPGAANWMAVSEEPPDDNSSYVTDATAGDIDRYTYPSIAGSQVFAVNVWMRAEKDDSGTRTIRAAVKSGSTVSDNGADFALTLNSYADFVGIFETDPNTGVAWTVSGVNAAEFGVKTTA